MFKKGSKYGKMRKRYLRIISVLLMASVLSVPLSAADSFPDWERMEDEGIYIDVEEDVYEEGETVKIALRNDQNITHHPMKRYVKIFNMDTDELVFDGSVIDITLPIVPSEEVMEWNQTDMEGEQVIPGTYSVIFQARYGANFTIEEDNDQERDMPLPSMLLFGALATSSAIWAVRKKRSQR